MKRRWLRFVVALLVTGLTTCLLVAGATLWLHRSDSLAPLAAALWRHFSGQEITVGRVEFPTWKTLALVDVRLRQRVAAWQLTVICPRLEARYDLAGLIGKRGGTLHLQRPRVVLAPSHGHVLSPPGTKLIPGGLAALPLGRMHVQQGTLQVRWPRHTVTSQPFDAILHQQRDGSLRIEASGNLAGNAAAFDSVAAAGSGSPPRGGVHLAAAATAPSRLAEILASVLSVPWQISHGALTSKTELNLQNQTLQGEVTLAVEQLRIQGRRLTLRDAALDTTFSLEADLRRGELLLEGTATLQAETVRLPPDIAATGMSVTTPWRLSSAADGWQLTATPDTQVRTAALDSTVRVSRLTGTIPVEVRRTAGGLQYHGTPSLQAQDVRLHTTSADQAVFQIAEVRGRLGVRGTETALSISSAEVQTQGWQRPAAAQPEVVPRLTVSGSGSVDLRQQRLTLQEVVATVPELGSLSGAGVWHWSSHTFRDVSLRLEPSDLNALRERLRPLVPAAWWSWHLDGQTSLQARASRLVLRQPRSLHGLELTWRLHDAALSHPSGTYASEHLNGALRVSAAFDGAADRSTLQGTLTLQPFALLLGSLFPALEDQRIAPEVTFAGVYDARAAHLRLNVTGRLGDLGVVTLAGVVHEPLGTRRYDLQTRLSVARAARLWQTFVYDPVQFPTLAHATVQGQLDSRLQLRGDASQFTLHGSLALTDLAFRTDTVDLRGVTLRLPVQLRYPLPATPPKATSLPPEAYGPLSIATMRVGGAQVGSLSTRIALRSDTVLFQHDIQLALLGGWLRLEELTAQHLLRPQRQISMRLRLQQLDLRQLGRGQSSLPLAGELRGEFSRLQIHGDRLETRGALELEVAGGLVRIANLQGWDLFSTVPTLRGALTTATPLSLSRLTEIYPIGGMGGAVHFTVADLTLTAWEPAAFVLDFAVQSPGGETRQITLRALNNLLFATGSAKVATSLLGETYRLPYRRFGATITLRNDILQVRGKYHDRAGKEYIMQAPALGGGVSIINRVPDNGIPFQDFLQRLQAAVLEKPDVQVR